MRIRGYQRLVEGSDPEARKDLLEILEVAINAVDPYRCVRDILVLNHDRLRAGSFQADLSRVSKIFVVGTGKASVGMAKAVFDTLGDRITHGEMSVLEEGNVGPICLNRSTHPHPSIEGMEGARKILELCKGAGPRDLVICLISGGGSAMMPLPPPGVSVMDKRVTAEMLMLAGADIEELNTVRKHLSLIKGGKLAGACYPAKVLSLVMSDVVGDPLGSICSGPTAPDPTTFEDAIAVVTRFGLEERLPPSVMEYLERGKEETPKPNDPIFGGVTNLLVANNRRALLAAKDKAEELGYGTMVLSSSIEGEAREVGKALASIGNEIALYGDPLQPPALVLAGGETTVTVVGKGKGGRNSELVLGGLTKIGEGVTMLSFGTDGVDGNSGAGGAISDEKSRGSDIRDFLDDNDSASYLEREGDLINTGPTGTNVGDIIMLAVRKNII